MAHVDQYIEDWLMVFRAAGISDEVAQEEFGLWCEGLDGEISNEYTQNALSVINAAERAIEELQGIAG